MPRWSELDAAKTFAGDALPKAFALPPDAFRPVPWLCYTGKCSKEEVRQAIEAMREQGIRSFFIFPIYGMEIEYMSEAWLDLVEMTLSHCRGVGMTAWIYDDYDWPNGSCAGKLLEQRPDYSIEALSPAFSELVEPGETASVSAEGEPLQIMSVDDAGNMTVVTAETQENNGAWSAQWVNSLQRMARLFVVSRVRQARKWVANSGSLWLKNKKRDAFFTDLLRGDASAAFVEMTHDAYYERLKSYFGATLMGFFDDEPSVFGHHVNAELASAFAARNGLALNDACPTLFASSNPNRLKIRNDYWTLVGEKLSAHLKRIDNWCAARGVDFTGHFLGEESPEQEIVSQGDIWPARKTMSLPGSDLLGCQTNYGVTPARATYSSPGNYSASGLILTTRVAAATARFNGSARVMSEVFGVMPYNIAPVDLMNHAHWLTAMGIDLLNDNLLTLSFEGFRKRAQGGRHFTTPWWKYYRDFAEAAGRCAVMTTAGKIPAKIGVLYPALTSKALRCDRRNDFGKNPEDKQMLTRTNRFTQLTAEALVRGRWDWEIVFEELWEDADIAAGAARVGDLSLTTLIVPAAHVVSGKALKKLETFVAAGGRVLFIGDLPSLAIEDGLDVPARVAALTTADNVIHLALAADAPWQELRRKFERTLQEKPFARVDGVGADETLTVRRRAGDRDIFHIVNMSDRETDLFTAFDTDKPLTLWRPDDGKIYALSDSEILRLSPREGAFLVASTANAARVNSPAFVFHRQTPGSHAPFVAIGDAWDCEAFGLTSWEIFRPSPNIAKLTSWFRSDAENNDAEETPGEFPDPAAWRRAENDALPFSLNPEKIETIRLKQIFVADIVPPDLAVVVDNADYAEIYLNGEKLENPIPHTLWDAANLKYAIADKARPGANLLAIRVRVSEYYHPDVAIKGLFEGNVLEPVVLIGDFSREETASGNIRLTLPRQTAIVGDWREFGLANYLGDIVYRRDLTIDNGDRESWLDLGEVHCVASVRVNGADIGRRCWPPYRFRLDPFLKNGTNRLEIAVTGTLANLLGAAGWKNFIGIWERRAESGLYGPVRLYSKRPGRP